MSPHYSVKAEIYIEAGDAEEAAGMVKSMFADKDDNAWSHYDGWCITDSDEIKFSQWGW